MFSLFFSDFLNFPSLPLFLSFFPSITSTSASPEEPQVPLSVLEFPWVPLINVHKKNVAPSSSLFLVFSLICLFLRALSYSTCLSIFQTETKVKSEKKVKTNFIAHVCSYLKKDTYVEGTGTHKLVWNSFHGNGFLPLKQKWL